MAPLAVRTAFIFLVKNSGTWRLSKTNPPQDLRTALYNTDSSIQTCFVEDASECESTTERW